MEMKPSENLVNDVTDFIKKFVDEVNKQQSNFIVGKLGLKFDNGSEKGSSDYSMMLFHGGNTKASLLMQSINALRDLDESVDSMSEEDKQKYVQDYLAKLNQPVQPITTEPAN